MFWDVCDPEGVKIQNCYVSAGLSACLGSFSAPSWIRREQALGNAFLKCMSLVSLWEVNKLVPYFAQYFAAVLERILAIIL